MTGQDMIRLQAVGSAAMFAWLNPLSASRLPDGSPDHDARLVIFEDSWTLQPTSLIRYYRSRHTISALQVKPYGRRSLDIACSTATQSDPVWLGPQTTFFDADSAGGLDWIKRHDAIFSRIVGFRFTPRRKFQFFRRQPVSQIDLNPATSALDIDRCIESILADVWWAKTP